MYNSFLYSLPTVRKVNSQRNNLKMKLSMNSSVKLLLNTLKKQSLLLMNSS